MGKIFINAVSQDSRYKLFFALPIGFILTLNLVLFIWFRIRMAAEAILPEAVPSYKLFILLLALCSSVMIAFLAAVYHQFKNTTILIGNKGIAYISLMRKIRAKWEEAGDMLIIERKHGKTIHISTANGAFVLTPQFVEKDKPIPQVKYIKQILHFQNQNGEFEPAELETSEIYKTLIKFVPKNIKIKTKKISR